MCIEKTISKEEFLNLCPTMGEDMLDSIEDSIVLSSHNNGRWSVIIVYKFERTATRVVVDDDGKLSYSHAGDVA